MRLKFDDVVEEYLEHAEPKKDDSQELPIPPRRDNPIPWWTLPLVDTLLALLAFGLAYLTRYELNLFRQVLEINRAPFGPYIPFALLYAVVLYLINHGNRLYRVVRGRAWIEDSYIIVNSVTTSTVLQLALFFLFQPLVSSRLMLVYVAAYTIILLSVARLVLRIVLARLRSRGIGVQRVLLVGVGDSGQAVLRVMMARKDLGYHVVGYVDDDPDRGNVDLGRVKGLGKLDNLRSTIRKYAIDLVVITLPWSHHERILALVRTARKAGAEVRAVPDVFQLNMRQVHVENLDGIPLLGFGGTSRHISGTDRLMKRTIDLTLILLASPLLLVAFTLTTIAIRLEGPGPIIYRTRRVGEGGREFDMFKFRSMVPDADKYRQQLVEAAGEDPRHPKIKDDPRITHVGAFIRRTSLDELPNLLNVLRGEMSLVGPRPPTPDELALYDTWHRQRLQVIPGMTGLWQISGRSDIPFDEMCLLDIYYIENWSVRLDLGILVMTVPYVLLRRGAY